MGSRITAHEWVLNSGGAYQCRRCLKFAEQQGTDGPCPSVSPDWRLSRRDELAIAITKALEADHESVDMSPEAVGKRLAEGWLEGTDHNSVDELRAAITHLARRLGSMAEIIHDDDAVGAIADAFRGAADTMEAEFGERLRRSVRHKMKRRATCSLG